MSRCPTSLPLKDSNCHPTQQQLLQAPEKQKLLPQLSRKQRQTTNQVLGHEFQFLGISFFNNRLVPWRLLREAS